jgi:hypothetical protein
MRPRPDPVTGPRLVCVTTDRIETARTDGACSSDRRDQQGPSIRRTRTFVVHRRRNPQTGSWRTNCCRPTQPTRPSTDASGPKPFDRVAEQRPTWPFGATAHPVSSVPAGRTDDGYPVGSGSSAARRGRHSAGASPAVECERAGHADDPVLEEGDNPGRTTSGGNGDTRNNDRTTAQ